MIEPSYEIMNISCGLDLIELAGRVCYKSENLVKDGSAEIFCDKIIKSHHESVIEHGNITVKFICNRGFTHELVRHRIAAYSQESSRYCAYSRDKFGGEITVIRPPGFEKWSTQRQVNWTFAMLDAEKHYLRDLKEGGKPQEARGMLPIDVKTEIVSTLNFRSWRHVFRERCSKAAHPSMRQLMIPLREELKTKIPVVFDDLV